MINLNKCIIELNVNSTNYLVSEGNKVKGFIEHKGHTSEGAPIHYFEKDYIVLTPNEILQRFGPYQVIYI